jgi:hypothetical protein
MTITATCGSVPAGEEEGGCDAEGEAAVERLTVTWLLTEPEEQATSSRIAAAAADRAAGRFNPAT